jgi:hypothetical protein
LPHLDLPLNYTKSYYTSAHGSSPCSQHPAVKFAAIQKRKMCAVTGPSSQRLACKTPCISCVRRRGSCSGLFAYAMGAPTTRMHQ